MDSGARYPRPERTQTDFYSPGSAMMAHTIAEPSTISESLTMRDARDWKDAILSELSSLRHHHTWQVVSRPSEAKIIPTRFVFKRKLNENGTVSRHKVRLVVKGYMQGSVDDTYAPVVEFTSVRVALTVAIQKGFRTRQLDIRTAFLHGEVDEEIFISPPPRLQSIGIELCKCSKALKLCKGLYGLK